MRGFSRDKFLYSDGIPVTIAILIITHNHSILKVRSLFLMCTPLHMDGQARPRARCAKVFEVVVSIYPARAVRYTLNMFGGTTWVCHVGKYDL